MKLNGLRTLILLFAIMLAMHPTASALEIPDEIETECPAGCWFIVNDESASLFIDIFPSNFVIPQEAGSKVRVY